MKGKEVVLDLYEGEISSIIKARKGFKINVQKEKNGKIRISEVAICNSDETNFMPPIPKGAKIIEIIVHETIGNIAFVMQYKGSEITFVRTNFLKSNGTLDGIHFDQQFGRRKWKDEKFSEDEFHEEVPKEFVESVKVYGGFFVAKYHPSLTRDEKVQSVKGELPLVDVKYNEAKRLSASFVDENDDVVSMLQFGACYDTIGEWEIETDEITKSQWINDSTDIGHFGNSKDAKRKVLPTGYKEKWCLNGIDSIAGNVEEWTQEKNSSYCVARGSSCTDDGCNLPACYRDYYLPSHHCKDTSFRFVLYMKVALSTDKTDN